MLKNCAASFKWPHTAGSLWPRNGAQFAQGKGRAAVITFVRGDILRSEAEALVDPVNTVGVAGAGLAKQFAGAFPELGFAYEAYCHAGRARLGTVWATRDRPSGKWVVFFPTKRHWRERSTMECIVDGLASLRALIERRGWRSVAIPAVGCGLGGLSWKKVCPEIEKALGDLAACNVMVYVPRDQPLPREGASNG
jgi:O-acetyl-ADP-ribose deacetylase (regulator of RNase III)